MFFLLQAELNGCSSSQKKAGESFIPFVKPCLDEAEYSAVQSCLESNWITTGPRVAAFEVAIGHYLGAKNVLALSSNTAGLYLSLKALQIGKGDEVITTPLTFAATANVIEHVGATPVFVDIDPETRNINVEQIENALTEKTRALMPVHMGGVPCNLRRLYEIAKKHNLRVIEDAAHAFGATTLSHDQSQSNAFQKIGYEGDIQVFSFQAGKNITTGEGGAIIVHNDLLFEKIKKLAFHGFDRAAWDRFQKKGSALYDIVAPGLKFNMMDMQAAIGLAQLKKIDTFQAKRTFLAERYLRELRECSYLEMPPKAQGQFWHLFSPLLKLERLKGTRTEIMALLKEVNIGTGVHYPAVHLFSYYREKYNYQEGLFPHTEKVGNATISLPLFPNLTEKEQDYVIVCLKKILEKQSR